VICSEGRGAGISLVPEGAGTSGAGAGAGLFAIAGGAAGRRGGDFGAALRGRTGRTSAGGGLTTETEMYGSCCVVLTAALGHESASTSEWRSTDKAMKRASDAPA
jgi:hypothetical protein